MNTDEINVLIDEVGKRVYLPALKLIQGDPHQWSNRGCQTCRTISNIIGESFGCVLYAETHKKKVTI